MAVVTLDFGSKVDMLNKDELREALIEDARERAKITGVKQFRMWLNGGTVGMGGLNFTTTGNPPQGPAQGYIWMVMNLGIELSAAAALKIYLNSGLAAAGSNRLIASVGTGSAVPTFPFSKGQFPLFAGDTVTFVVGSNAIESIFMTGIEIPAERIGELLL